MQNTKTFGPTAHLLQVFFLIFAKIDLSTCDAGKFFVELQIWHFGFSLGFLQVEHGLIVEEILTLGEIFQTNKLQVVFCGQV